MSELIPLIARSNAITSREAFGKALAAVNTLVRENGVTVENAKRSFTQTEALRAWASFDKRLTNEEKKEANRAQLRVVQALSELADREQPKISTGRGFTAGPCQWLRERLQITKSVTNRIRALNDPERFRVALEAGRAFSSVSSIRGSRKNIRSLPVSRMHAALRDKSPMREASRIPTQARKSSAVSARRIAAWFTAYADTLQQLIDKEETK